MIKKVLLIMMVCFLLLPAHAMADDGYWYDFNGETLQITIKRLQDDFSIGENYSLKVTIANTSKYSVDLISLDSSIFEENSYFLDVAPEADPELKPGEKITVTCTAEIPYNISWYKKDGDFYYDLIMSVDYLIYFSDEEDDYSYGSSDDQPVAIKINNLNDGSNFLEMEYVGDDCKNIFTKYLENINYEEYITNQETTVSIQNKSEATLENFILDNSYGYKSPIYTNPANGISLSSAMQKEVSFDACYSVILENLPESITDRHQAIFTVDGKYYAVGLEKEIEMQIAAYPYLDCSINEIGDKLQVTFENNTGFDFENFYFGEPFDISSEKAVIDGNMLMPCFTNGQNAEFTVYKYQGYEYYVGYILGDYFFKWNAELYKSDDGDSYCFLSEYEQYDYIFLSNVTPSPSPSPTPKLTPSPTLTNTPTPTATPTPKPTATPSSTKQLTSEPTASPTTEITDVKKSSPIPFWVWYVLAVAVVAGAVLTVTLRRKNKDKFE